MLTLLNQQSSVGSGPCHLTVDRTGKNVLVANYGSGSVACLPIQADGRSSAASSFIQHEGKSATPAGKKAPCPFDQPRLANRFAIVADLGLDRVFVYKLDADKGTLTPNEPPFATIAPGSGPRHFAFHPDGRFGYVISEMANTVTAFAYDADRGILTEIQAISTLPPGSRARATPPRCRSIPRASSSTARTAATTALRSSPSIRPPASSRPRDTRPRWARTRATSRSTPRARTCWPRTRIPTRSSSSGSTRRPAVSAGRQALADPHAGLHPDDPQAWRMIVHFTDEEPMERVPYSVGVSRLRKYLNGWKLERLSRVLVTEELPTIFSSWRTITSGFLHTFLFEPEPMFREVLLSLRLLLLNHWLTSDGLK